MAAAVGSTMGWAGATVEELVDVEDRVWAAEAVRIEESFQMVALETARINDASKIA
jgi:hypothetical protein